MFVSVFNDVLGPVMRGPSSSHTAGSYHIGRVARDLLGCQPKRVVISFDPAGSYAHTYLQQGVDLAFVTGIMGWQQTDVVFTYALNEAERLGVSFEFIVTGIEPANHPNYAILELEGEEGRRVTLEARSVGGGTFEIVKFNGVPLLLDGKSHELLISLDAGRAVDVENYLNAHPLPGCTRKTATVNGKGLLQFSANSTVALPPELLAVLGQSARIYRAEPVYHTRKAAPPFHSAETMIHFAQEHDFTLGEAVLAYESAVLGMSEDEAIEEMVRRWQIMKNSVRQGLDDEQVNMLLLQPMAGMVENNVRQGRVPIGGIHAKAYANAMACMHTCNSQGVVCAAPTGGAAGTLPGLLVTMEEEFGLDERALAMMLFAAGGIGLIVAIRATFAAEMAGCQVEIGAAGAMGAAAVVEFVGGTVEQACDAAAISLQNSMGSVCDPVQGACEIPCHTRNGAAAANALTNADMIMAGYVNPIPLDETVDAVYKTGLMLPGELRCTAKGGIALAPSALALNCARKQ